MHLRTFPTSFCGRGLPPTLYWPCAEHMCNERHAISARVRQSLFQRGNVLCPSTPVSVARHARCMHAVSFATLLSSRWIQCVLLPQFWPHRAWVARGGVIVCLREGHVRVVLATPCFFSLCLFACLGAATSRWLLMTAVHGIPRTRFGAHGHVAGWQLLVQSRLGGVVAICRVFGSRFAHAPPPRTSLCSSDRWWGGLLTGPVDFTALY